MARGLEGGATRLDIAEDGFEGIFDGGGLILEKIGIERSDGAGVFGGLSLFHDIDHAVNG